jgi:hypothetical protein
VQPKHEASGLRNCVFHRHRGALHSAPPSSGIGSPTALDERSSHEKRARNTISSRPDDNARGQNRRAPTDPTDEAAAWMDEHVGLDG